MLKIYTDGSCRDNGKKDAVGGWAFVILNNENKVGEASDYEINTTNNRMEMLAIIKAIQTVEILPFDKCKIYTDSAYVHNCIKQKWYKNWITNGWVNSSKEPVKNKDLWEQLIPYFENERFEFNKVKGHANSDNIHHYWNNYVDKLARTISIFQVERRNI